MATTLMPTLRVFFRFLTLAVLLLLTPTGAAADLGKLSIEQLLNLEVTSVAKRPQTVGDSAAAISVITQEEIRRSGATTIPELLRLVPGLQVARVNSNTWAISARGFNLVFADKLLVLIDGRSVYSPLFSGVYWDIQDTLLEDIERIEVIRGPGATLWGANAVNGVINIITKPSAETQGVLLSGGGGDEELGFGNARYGGALGEDTHYRVYAKHFVRDDFVSPEGQDAADGWLGQRGGFRVDSQITSDDFLTVQGDGYYGESEGSSTLVFLEPPYQLDQQDTNYLAGGNGLTRWTRDLGDSSQLQLQLYYDRTDRSQLLGSQSIDIYDLELQHQLSPFENHQLIWGAGYRTMHDLIKGNGGTFFLPESRDFDLVSGFAQDEIKFFEDKLRLTLGSKIEHNDFTGVELQPNIRALANLSDAISVWGAVSRAVRTPNRANSDVRTPLQSCPGGLTQECPGVPNLTTVFQVTGNRAVDAEELLAYELGYRQQVTPQITLDVATFFNRYRSLVSTNPAEPVIASEPVPHLLVPILFGNEDDADAYGVELSADYRPNDWWRVSAGYAFVNIEFDEGGIIGDGDGPDKEAETPENHLIARSLMTLPGNLEFDSVLRFVDRLPISGRQIDSYFELDLRLGWRADKNLDIEIVGQNLLHNQHSEFVSEFVDRSVTDIERGVFGKVTWRYN